MRSVAMLIAAMCFMALLATGCKTTGTDPDPSDPAVSDPGSPAQAQAQDPMVCMEACDNDCKAKWTSSPMAYDYCFEGCLDKCSQ